MMTEFRTTSGSQTRLIRDAIAQANSEYHVYFLLTAYMENAQHREHSGVWAAQLTSLPINGIGDLERRRDIAGALMAMFFQHMKSANGLIRECHDLFTLALERLAWLRQPIAARPTGDARVMGGEEPSTTG